MAKEALSFALQDLDEEETDFNNNLDEAETQNYLTTELTGEPQQELVDQTPQQQHLLLPVPVPEEDDSSSDYEESQPKKRKTPSVQKKRVREDEDEDEGSSSKKPKAPKVAIEELRDENSGSETESDDEDDDDEEEEHSSEGEDEDEDESESESDPEPEPKSKSKGKEKEKEKSIPTVTTTSKPKSKTLREEGRYTLEYLLDPTKEEVKRFREEVMNLRRDVKQMASRVPINMVDKHIVLYNLFDPSMAPPDKRLGFANFRACKPSIANKHLRSLGIEVPLEQGQVLTPEEQAEINKGRTLTAKQRQEIVETYLNSITNLAVESAQIFSLLVTTIGRFCDPLKKSFEMIHRNTKDNSNIKNSHRFRLCLEVLIAWGHIEKSIIKSRTKEDLGKIEKTPKWLSEGLFAEAFPEIMFCPRKK